MPDKSNCWFINGFYSRCNSMTQLLLFRKKECAFFSRKVSEKKNNKCELKNFSFLYQQPHLALNLKVPSERPFISLLSLGRHVKPRTRSASRCTIYAAHRRSASQLRVNLHGVRHTETPALILNCRSVIGK